MLSTKQIGTTALDRVTKDKDLAMAVTGLEGDGKTQIAGSKVMMADGIWKNIEDIKVGDLVLSPQQDGSYRFSSVIQIHSRYSNANYDIVKLNKRKKLLYVCSSNHELPINYKKFYKKQGKEKEWKVKNITAEEYSKCTKGFKVNSTTLTSFLIPKFINQENCLIEPYSLGVWLGDGHYLKSSLGITSNNPKILEEISKTYPLMSIANKQKTPAKAYNFSIMGDLGILLRKYDLKDKGSGNKFIPKEALYSDAQYRTKLLAGLIDSDGYKSKNQSYSICTKSRQLAEGILFLVYSLGGKGNSYKIKKAIKSLGFVGEYYNVSFYLGNFNLPLKCNYKIRNKKFFYLSANRVAIDAVPSNPAMVYGFTLDSPSGWYITDNFCITHNSCLSVQIGIGIDPSFKMFRNVLFDPSVKIIRSKIYNLPPYTPIIADEAIKIMYKLNWGSKIQKYLNKIYAVCRNQNKISIFNMPRFTDFAEYFRNHRLRLWIHIVDPINNEKPNGHAVVIARSWNPVSVDPWGLKIFEKKLADERKRGKKDVYYSLDDKLALFEELPGFVDVLRFNWVKQSLWDEYLKLKAEVSVDEEERLEDDKMVIEIDAWKNRTVRAINIFKAMGYSGAEIAKVFDTHATSVASWIKKFKAEEEIRKVNEPA